MRWKLLVLTSLAAAVAGGGSCAALHYLTLAPSNTSGRFDWLLPASLLPPLAAITYASVFAYRHTARRRKLQAALTAIFSLLLTLGLLFAYLVSIIAHD